MSTSSCSKMIKLETSNGKVFKVEEPVALQSETIKRLIEGHSANTTIRLPKITNKILAMVIQYCKMHVEDPCKEKVVAEKKLRFQYGKTHVEEACKDKVVAEKNLRCFDADFVNVRLGTLCDLVSAADYLKIKSLLELISQTYAGLTPIREINRARDKKEDKVRRENTRAYIYLS